MMSAIHNKQTSNIQQPNFHDVSDTQQTNIQYTTTKLSSCHQWSLHFLKGRWGSDGVANFVSTNDACCD